jgi:hypothetical protein
MKAPEKILQYGGVFFITLFLTFCFFRINGFFSNKKSEIIRSDGFGYYSYLPAIFIYGDYSQEFVKEKVHKHYTGTGLPEYMQMVDNRPVDKYFFGTAVLMYPFFMTAHWLALIILTYTSISWDWLHCFMFSSASSFVINFSDYIMQQLFNLLLFVC